MINADTVPGTACPNRLGSWRGLSLTNNTGVSVTWVHLTKLQSSIMSHDRQGLKKKSKASAIPENMKLFLLTVPQWQKNSYLFLCEGNRLRMNPLSAQARPLWRWLLSHGLPSRHHTTDQAVSGPQTGSGLPELQSALLVLHWTQWVQTNREDVDPSLIELEQ